MMWVLLAVMTVLACILTDSLFYQTFTVVPLNFFLINVYKNLGMYYSYHVPFYLCTSLHSFYQLPFKLF